MSPKTLAEIAGAQGEPRTVPCADCGTDCECSDMAWELAKTFSRELVNRGERALQRGTIVRCDPCSTARRRRDAQAMNDHAQTVAQLRRRVIDNPKDVVAMRTLREINPTPETHELIKWAAAKYAKSEKGKGKRNG